jgi:VIT1/CCC1 family predicted Fe2+/Mn2+ transporter
MSVSALEGWREEKQSAWLYRRLTASEPDPARRQMFAALADAAEAQARAWASEARRRGEPVPADFEPGRRVRLVAGLAARLGPARVRPLLAALKVRGMSAYQSLPLRLGHAMPTSADQVETHHRSTRSGGNLRAAVFGVNDGLVSTTSLVMGVAGAAPDPPLILVTGVAGLLAGAFSMAAGEYVSMRSQRELYEYQIGLEREELAQYPEEEAEELALIYQARGVPLARAREIAAEMLKDPEQALDVLAREELGLDPSELGSPWGAAASSFAAFASGGVVPLAPFLVGLGTLAVPAAAGLAALALFAVGATLSLFTGRGALASGLRMTLIGGGAGLVTFGIGHLLGVTLA